MHTENLHITLAFLGQVDAARLDDIVAAARSVQARRFMLRMDQPGYWKHNRIAWLGASQVPAELEAMVAELRSALEASRIAFDPKPFVAHVTLLRNARPPSDEWPALAVVHWPVSGSRSFPRNATKAARIIASHGVPRMPDGDGRNATRGLALPSIHLPKSSPIPSTMER